jgi:high-affinity iron transporter
VLDGGHRLVAEEQHTALTRGDIALHWQNSFRTIDDLLAQAMTLSDGKLPPRQSAGAAGALSGFKNSEMEMSVRQNRSAKEAAAINSSLPP